MRLKKRMVRLESRKLKPNVTGPSVPVENLRTTGRWDYRVRHNAKVHRDSRQNVCVRREPDEKDLIELGLDPLFYRNRVNS
jgi:hypothetical protein